MSLRGRQVALVKKYARSLENQNCSELGEFKDQFIENLKIEMGLEHFMGVEVSRYPIFFDNMLETLGYRCRIGDIQTVSGTQPYDPYHVAYNSSRVLIIGDYPASLFGNIADVQPLTSKPIIGISHTTWINREHDDKWENERFDLSKSLGIGRLKIDDPKILLDGIRLDSNNDQEKLKRIAEEIGLLSFLKLSIDSLPIYGTFRTKRYNIPFQENDIKKIILESSRKGHELSEGSITNFSPDGAIKDPQAFLSTLNKNNVVVTKPDISITETGKKYVEKEISHTPQEAALTKITNVITSVSKLADPFFSLYDIFKA